MRSQNLSSNVSARAPDSQPLVRLGLTRTRSLAYSTMAAALAFLLLNWRGCWLFRSRPRDLWDFLYFFIWLLLFFLVRTRWRLALLAVTLALVLPYLGLHGLAEQNAAPESAAVHALLQFRSALDTYRTAPSQSLFPAELPSVLSSSDAQKFYRYAYIPRRSASGQIVGYLLQAAPARRECEFHRSFTLSDDGKIFWTLEPRPATTADHLLEQ